MSKLHKIVITQEGTSEALPVDVHQLAAPLATELDRFAAVTAMGGTIEADGVAYFRDIVPPRNKNPNKPAGLR